MDSDSNGTGQILRCGFVALSGLPNAGKSTLLNAILGQEIALVTPKPQTTRNRIVGVHNMAGAQLVLVDTPGIDRGHHELGRRMLRGAREAVSDADVVVRVIDAGRLVPERLAAREDLAPAGKPTVVALNKVDLVHPKQRLLPLIEGCSKVEGVEVVVPVCARSGDGVEPLLREIADRLPVGPQLYPPEMITDRPEQFLAAETIRGAVLALTRQEVPHATAVMITGWRESDGACHLQAKVFVEKPSQRAIIVGRGGEMIKEIGQRARRDLARLLGSEVHLGLRVEVSEQWRGDPQALRELGYDE